MTSTGELLSGKTAVVTGGASGNGRAIARTFAAHGASVVVADVRRAPREEGRPIDEEITDAGGDAGFVECDVTSRSDIETAVSVADEFGGLDIMVNNAGVYREESFVDVTEAEFEQLMDVNVKGVFLGSQVAAEQLVEHGEGSIINMSSVAGIAGSRNSPTYSASKGAVRLLTYSLAAELGSAGVRVNALHPGVIRTAMTTEDVEIADGERAEEYLKNIPLDRVGEPEDVADAALFLASDLSGYITGTSLLVDGGMVNAG